jgi:hypothetical protein
VLPCGKEEQWAKCTELYFKVAFSFLFQVSVLPQASLVLLKTSHTGSIGKFAGFSTRWILSVRFSRTSDAIFVY